MFAALLFIYNSYTSTLPSVDPGIDFRSTGTIILFLLVRIPVYVLACLTVIVAYRGFVRWFYRVNSRKKKIESNKGVSVEKSVGQVEQDYQKQIEYLRQTSPDNPPPKQALEAVSSFYTSAVQMKRKTDEAIQQIRSETKNAVEKRKRDMEQEVQETEETWFAEVSEAAKNYVCLFERQFYSSNRDRGPVYWLFFRFCGNDGPIATAPRGIGHLRTVIRVRVSITEDSLLAEVTDTQGKQLIRNQELRYYRFAEANERTLTQPSERMGYSAALLACTLFEANMALRQAAYDESFSLEISADADVNGFEFEYSGVNYT